LTINHLDLGQAKKLNIVNSGNNTGSF